MLSDDNLWEPQAGSSTQSLPNLTPLTSLPNKPAQLHPGRGSFSYRQLSEEAKRAKRKVSKGRALKRARNTDTCGKAGTRREESSREYHPWDIILSPLSLKCKSKHQTPHMDPHSF